MTLFDRYQNRTLSLDRISGKVDFGRFVLLRNDADGWEPTGKETGLSLEVCRDLLDNATDCNFFLKTFDDVERGNYPPPVIRNVSERLQLTDFERLLQKHLFHIECAFRKPHELLKRELEKVNVASARKIPSKSYEHMAGHTEDWEHYSVFSFKPRKVIHEELEVDYDLYENRALLSFVERSLRDIDERIDEMSKLKDFLTRLEILLEDMKEERSWYKKINRSYELVGVSFEEAGKASALLQETQTVLSVMHFRLAGLMDERLFKLVGKGRVHTPELRATNVLVNHKHYRYLRQLWPKVDNLELNEQEKHEQAQSTYRGLADFVLSTFHYCLKEHLGFVIESSGRSIAATHPRDVFGTVTVTVNERLLIVMEAGAEKLEFVVVGNRPQQEAETEEILTAHPNRYVLHLNLDQTSEREMVHPRMIPISPYDVDTTERISSVIRGIMLRRYHENLTKEHKAPNILKDYHNAIQLPSFIRFDESGYKKFRFTGLPSQHNINLSDWQKRIQSSERYSKSGRTIQASILTALEQFHSSVSKEVEELKRTGLFCFKCNEPLNPKTANTENFDYIKCSSCQSVVENKGGKLSFRIEIEKYKDLQTDDWGCDRISVLSQPKVLG